MKLTHRYYLTGVINSGYVHPYKQEVPFHTEVEATGDEKDMRTITTNRIAAHHAYMGRDH